MPIDTSTLLFFLASFLIGSIPFSVIAMWRSGTDIRSIGSGNPGFNNVLRFSKKRALISLVGDVGKGFVPVWLLYSPDQFVNVGWLISLGTVFGHCYSPWLKFRGGKGIATSAGAMLAIYPAIAAGAIVFFVVVRVLGSVTKLNERGAWASLLTWVFFTVLIHFQHGMPDTKYALLMTAFLVWCHKSNIGRMLGR
ncbi:MAG: glycerol-3-phosphate acyltransferase [Bryobacterales bacterium]|nr:glycerol-3-phosphate acyltransferase [Bryobacterales bacterium]MDE0625660.1 glycerol-3-phosphate acyltransferase [Bryobacterales bacterium]